MIATQNKYPNAEGRRHAKTKTKTTTNHEDRKNSNDRFCAVYLSESHDFLGQSRKGAGGWFKAVREDNYQLRSRTIRFFDNDHRISLHNRRTADDSLDRHGNNLIDLVEQVVDGISSLVLVGIPGEPVVYSQLEPETLRKGDLVYGRYQNGTAWYRGRIASVNHNHHTTTTNNNRSNDPTTTCTIVYDNGNAETGIPYGSGNHGNVEKVVLVDGAAGAFSKFQLRTTTTTMLSWMDGVAVQLPSKKRRSILNGVIKVNNAEEGDVCIEYKDKNDSAKTTSPAPAPTRRSASSSHTVTAVSVFAEKRAVDALMGKVLVDALHSSTLANRTVQWPPSPPSSTLRRPPPAALAVGTTTLTPLFPMINDENLFAGCCDSDIGRTGVTCPAKRIHNRSGIENRVDNSVPQKTALLLCQAEALSPPRKTQSIRKRCSATSESLGVVQNESTAIAVTCTTARTGNHVVRGVLKSNNNRTSPRKGALSSVQQLQPSQRLSNICPPAARARGGFPHPAAREEEDDDETEVEESVVVVDEAFLTVRKRPRRRVKVCGETSQPEFSVKQEPAKERDHDSGAVVGANRVVDKHQRRTPKVQESLLSRESQPIRKGTLERINQCPINQCPVYSLESQATISSSPGRQESPGQNDLKDIDVAFMNIKPIKPGRRERFPLPNHPVDPPIRSHPVRATRSGGRVTYPADEEINDANVNEAASICKMPRDHDDASALSLLTEMSPLNASKLISSLTAPSTQWTCELAALLNDFYRVVLPTSSIVELIRFLGTGPMYNSTPFPDQHIMDNCVIYLNTLLNNHGMIHSVACQLDETYWEECLQNLSGDYYTADGDEKRYNHDAVKRQSQTLHVKLCVMKTFVAILQPQIKACVDDPVLVETQPLIRCFVSHRNGVKRALERFVSSTALLLIHHGYWVVGDKDLSLASKSLDVLKLEPPPEYLVHNTEAYATELFAVLGHVSTSLAWLYQFVEKQSIKLVTRVITHSFQNELRQSKFDPSPFLSETMSKRDYLDCIRFQFALGLTDDLVPGLRSNVADGIGVDMEMWETLQ